VQEVEEGGWAAAVSIEVGSEIAVLAGQEVGTMSQKAFNDVLQQRPLEMRFFKSADTPAVDLQAMAEVSLTGLADTLRGLQLQVLPQYDLVRMSDRVGSVPPFIKAMGKRTKNVSHMFAQSHFSVPEYSTFSKAFEDKAPELDELKERGDVKQIAALLLELLPGAFGDLSLDRVQAIWKWPEGAFHPKAGNMDVQINFGACGTDPSDPSRCRVRLLRHFFNLPKGLGSHEVRALAGTAECLLDWAKLEELSTGGKSDPGRFAQTVALGPTYLQAYLSMCVGGTTLQSKRLVDKRGSGEAGEPVATDVAALHVWLKNFGEAEPEDPGVFSEFYFGELLKADSPMKTCKAMGMAYGHMERIVLAHRSKGAKGCAEIVEHDLARHHFDTERNEWLVALFDRFDADPTKGIAIFGPRKCGKTQLLQTLAFEKSKAEIEELAAKGQDVSRFVAGFYTSNHKDNFPRGDTFKRCRPLILDDTDLENWKQFDWLAWLDLVARGQTAETRYSNTSLTGYRCLASNEEISSVMRKIADGKREAIFNKGFFVDLWDKQIVSKMRPSTWYPGHAACSQANSTYLGEFAKPLSPRPLAHVEGSV